MSDEWIPTEWTQASCLAAFNGTDPIIRRHVSPFYAGERFAVHRLGDVLNKRGQWEHEPLPSSRTQAFYKRCRFDTFEEAVSAAAIAKGRGE